jgi:hypothetical protein
MRHQLLTHVLDESTSTRLVMQVRKRGSIKKSEEKRGIESMSDFGPFVSKAIKLGERVALDAGDQKD